MAIWVWTFLNFWIFVVKRIATRFNTFDNRSLMHQSILAELSPPPPGYCGAFARLVSPGVGHLQILRCPEAGHLSAPGPFPSF